MNTSYSKMAVNNFIFKLINPLCLVNMYNTQRNFEVKMRQSITYWPPLWNKVYDYVRSACSLLGNPVQNCISGFSKISLVK